MHVVDSKLDMVHVCNSSNWDMVISWKHCLGVVKDINVHHCYLLHLVFNCFAVKASGVMKQAVAIAAILSAAMVPLLVNQSPTNAFHSTILNQPLEHTNWNNQGITVKAGLQETQLENSITVFGDSSTVLQLSSIVNNYPLLWKDYRKTVNIPKS